MVWKATANMHLLLMRSGMQCMNEREFNEGLQRKGRTADFIVPLLAFVEDDRSYHMVFPDGGR